MIVAEGKSFKSSALECGYSRSVAGNGLKSLLSWSPAATKAIQDEHNRLFSLDKLKPLAIQRLHAEITNYKSSAGMKAIELAGRFKEADWFVRNVDVQVGIFAGLGADIADPAADSITQYVDSEE